MTTGILGIALSGLNAAQAAIRTTEHNIANVNTAGYRRQEVSTSAQSPQYSGAGYFGTGVGIDTIRSVYNQFLDNELLLNQSQVASNEAYSSQAAQIDKLLGDAGSGLSTALDSFFSAVNELANDPTSDASRQVLLSAGNNLAGRIGTLDGKFDNYITAANNEVENIAMSVTNLSTQVAGLNNQISRSEAIGGQPANDLRDQRDQLIAQINRLVNVSTLRQADGSLNVYIGNGQPLVVGGSANAMTAVSDPSNNQLKQPALTIGGVTISLAASMVAGGQLGGVLGVRDEVVLPAVRELNRLALAFADQFNTRHLLGFDKNGAAGTEFFTPVATMLQQPQPFAGTSGAATLTLTDSSQLEASDYLLSYDGANFTLTRLSDGASSTGGIGAVTTINGQDQGFTLAVAGEAAGDRWLVRPSADAAGLFDVAIADPDAIAASGASADSPGDNSNALALAGLRVNGGFGGVSFDGTYNALISRTASLASESDLNLAAFTSLTAQAESARQSASGVNLDEEAVNLIRFQQAYQASAKAIQVATTLFDELLAMVR